MKSKRPAGFRADSPARLAGTVAAWRRNPDWDDWHWQCDRAAGLGKRMAAACGATAAAARFAARVTPYYAALIDFDDPADPLARQVAPDPRECDAPLAGDRADPFGERDDLAPFPGCVHRFPDRLLIRCEAPCATTCRYCTRRNLMGRAPGFQVAEHLERAIAYLGKRPAIREVIFSGGDPLRLEDDRIVAALDAVSALDSIDAVRIGTRMPVTAPMRITPELAIRLGRLKKTWVNTQFNHPRELTEAAVAACARLVEAGIPVSNQCVILRGVNDTVETLFALFAGLQRHRIRPYYAFAGDPVAGTAHLRVAPGRVRALARRLETRLGGLALPRFVADRPGAPSKTVLR